MSICVEYVFHSFTFSLCISFVLRWVSCRQHIWGSCFLIHSGTLCLLIGAFNPFKVIIDRYLFVVFFSLCTCILLSVFLFISSSQSSLLSISYRAGLVEMYSFSLLLSGKLFILPSILMRALLDRVVLVAGPCFSLLRIFLANLF